MVDVKGQLARMSKMRNVPISAGRIKGKRQFRKGADGGRGDNIKILTKSDVVTSTLNTLN